MEPSQGAVKTVPRSSVESKYQDELKPGRQSPRTCCVWTALKRALCCGCRAGSEADDAEQSGGSAGRAAQPFVLAASGDAKGESAAAAAATAAAKQQQEEKQQQQGTLKKMHGAKWSFDPDAVVAHGQLHKKAFDGGTAPSKGQTTTLNPYGNGGVEAGDVQLLQEGSDSETSVSDERLPLGAAGEADPQQVRPGSRPHARLASVQVEYDDVTIAAHSPPPPRSPRSPKDPGNPHGAPGEPRTTAAAEFASGAGDNCLLTAATLADILQRDDSGRSRDDHHHHNHHHNHRHLNNNNSSQQKNNKRRRPQSRDLEAELDRKVSQLLKKHQVDLLQTYSPSNVMDIMARHFRFSQEVSELSELGLHEVSAGLAEISREVCEDMSCPEDEARELVRSSVRRVSSKRSGALSSPTFQVSQEDSGDEALRLGHLVAQGDEC
ncbi:uncharacterized protein LOC142931215 [Petromyzon marinus]|uniref:uncharacterized protein LOC142931215 n=1 Tax=Petromyzon marinus TaxID=7757 RepID=UPI003F6FE650